jgi:quercetin dioxygenase-like cupin family protein
MRKALFPVIALSAVLLLAMQPAHGAIKVGSSCAKIGDTRTTADQVLVCKKSGQKKLWAKVAPPAAAPVSGVKVLLSKAEQTILNQPLLYPTSGPAQVSSAVVTLLPGEETGWHRHDAPMYAYILEGTVQVSYDGGVVNIYKAGESIMEATGVFHNGKNIGTGVLRILVVNIGASGVENTVKKL